MISSQKKMSKKYKNSSIPAQLFYIYLTNLKFCEVNQYGKIPKIL